MKLRRPLEVSLKHQETAAMPEWWALDLSPIPGLSAPVVFYLGGPYTMPSPPQLGTVPLPTYKNFLLQHGIFWPVSPSHLSQPLPVLEQLTMDYTINEK